MITFDRHSATEEDIIIRNPSYYEDEAKFVPITRIMRQIYGGVVRPIFSQVTGRKRH